MKLILIYGPPAVGKLTVANILSKATGYKVFRNHMFNSCVADIFPYDDKVLEPTLQKLTAKFRLEIFEEAAKNSVNFITCYGGAGKKRFNFFREVKKVIESHNGEVIFVQLLADKNELLNRVENNSRKNVKIDSKQFLENYLNNNPDFFDKFPDAEHITINNTTLPPEKAVNYIVKHYKL